MSRLEFRAAVPTPRPRAATLLVAIASACLAVTGQVPAPVLALQLAALGIAAWRRDTPWRWQQSGLVLNGGLAACALLAGAMALDGAPLAVALAQLALLASGLQLLDARPRRSEFLLVALALFQVVLASSLTDSLLFPPLLMAFLPTCVWTLIVHTLRTEALEAGDPGAASTVLSNGLLGTTLVASALSMALALVLFFLLPRLHEGLVPATSGAPQALGGFSDRVELGDLGRIRGDPTVMLRVETLTGEPPRPSEAYWRGLAFDHFDGRRWSVSIPSRWPVEGEPALGVRLGRAHREPEVVQRILREPVVAGVLFDPGRPLRLEGDTGRLERDANGSLYAPQTARARVRYQVTAAQELPSAAALAQDVALPPRNGERYLALPPLPPALHALAREITAEAGDDYARAAALERWLRRNGRYTDLPPPDGPADGPGPIERFLLGERAGHCEYFATAMALLARSVALPSRLVNGFAGGRENSVGDFVELAGSDAHAWVEIHFAEHGWVRFDPTPPDLRLQAAGSTWWTRIAELRSALEHLWYQHVLEFDRGQQVRATFAAWKALRRLGESTRESDLDARPGSWLERLRALPAAPILGTLAISGLVLVAMRLRRERRERGQTPPLPRAYARALRLLARRGWVRADGTTPRAFAAHLRTELPPAGAEAFARLTERYLATRWGLRSGPDGAAELRILRDSLSG